MPYEELQTLIEAVLKRCADLSLPRSSRRPAVSHTAAPWQRVGNGHFSRVPGCHMHAHFSLLISWGVVGHP